MPMAAQQLSEDYARFGVTGPTWILVAHDFGSGLEGWSGRIDFRGTCPVGPSFNLRAVPFGAPVSRLAFYSD